MGILGLARLIADCAPEAIKEQDVGSFFGRKIAIDASMAIYQFLIAIRSQSAMMTNDSGETTSHLVGMFYRTCKMLEAGIKPIYVFDGKAPELKSGELEKRKERRKEAEKGLAMANTAEDMEKFSKRLVRVGRQHNEDCKKLLQLLGCPIVCAPSEAEAQCAQLCKEGLVYAIATEDMDGLTFGTPKLIRSLSSGRPDEKAKEYNLDKVLNGLNINQEQFIDLCILMGCDYCPSIKGIGGKKGLDLIRKYGSIEEILRQKYNVHEFVDVVLSYTDKKDEIKQETNENDVDNEKDEIKESSDNKSENIKNESTVKSEKEDEMKEHIEDVKQEAMEEDVKEEDEEEDEKEDEKEEEIEKEGKSTNGKKNKSKNDVNPVPENWLFRGARQLFQQPDVLRNQITEADLKFKDVDEEGLIKFLCEENGFSEERIRPAIKRVREAKHKSNQSRIDSFFKVLPNQNLNKTPANNKKRASNSKGSESKRGRRPR